MLFSLFFLVTGITFLGETLGSVYGDQDNVHSILEHRKMDTTSESSVETKKNQIVSQLFEGRQKSTEANHPVESSAEVHHFHSEAEIFGSSGSTLKIFEKLGKRTFRRDPAKFRRLHRPNVNLDSPSTPTSTPTFGKYKSLSRDRSRHQLKRWSSIRKSEKTNDKPLEVEKRRIQDSIANRMVKKGSSIDEIMKNWSASEHDEEESKNEGTGRKVRIESVSDNGASSTRLLKEGTEKKQASSDTAESSQALLKSNIERLLESGTGDNAGSCQVVFKTLLALITNGKVKENSDSKTKRSPKKMVNENQIMADEATKMFDKTKKLAKEIKKMSNDTKTLAEETNKIANEANKMADEANKMADEAKQTPFLSQRSIMVSKNLSVLTISMTNESQKMTDETKQTFVTTQRTNTTSTSTMSPTKSFLLNITKYSSMKNETVTKKTPVTAAKNVSVESSTTTVKSTLMSKLEEQSKEKLISTEASTSIKSTSSELNKSYPYSAFTKSFTSLRTENVQKKKSEEDSALSFISLLLRHLRTELRTGHDLSSAKNETPQKNKVVSSVSKLVDYITSFMKLSYSVVKALMNKIDFKADLIDKRINSERFSIESSVVKDIFTKILSNILAPAGSKTIKDNPSTSQNNQSQSKERILLTNEIDEWLNGGKEYLTNNRKDSTMPDFRTLIGLARSDRTYVKEWRDSVLDFLSKQFHHFMESGIYERLSSFWPRSSITAESWTLRLAGYCAQIEIDENMAVVESEPLFCPFKRPECDVNAKYRDQRGSCNNLNNPLWGSANIPFRRILKNAYDDGISKPRSFGVGNVPLPNAKLISLSVFEKNDEKTNEHVNLFTVFFTQFVSHDITRFAMDVGDMGPVKVNCCLPDTVNRSECFPIFVKEATGSVRCLHFLRSMPTVPLGCQSHVRQQINQVTSFIDASNVYGSSLSEMKELRLFQRGLMKISLCGAESLPPTDKKGASECGINADQRQFPCFYAGDPRVNENPALALVHVLWLREHNRIARRLGEINPHWDDTKLYEETRKIISAIMQHVVYNELLPMIIGFKKAKEFKLLSGTGFFNDYEPNVNPTLENGVAAAAFRFGHGMISDRFLFLAGCPSAYSKCSPQSILNGPYGQELTIATGFRMAPPMCPYTTLKNVSSMFENVDVFHHSETELESLLRGLLMQSAEVATDTMLSPAITEKLFGHMDLMARNIQRGRDHGLPAYNKWRKWCGLPVARKFNSGKTGFTDHKIEVVKRFAQIYKDPEDVDLIIGGLTESPIEGALLGPTFVCMIGRQLQQLKFGDRFWYEKEGQFTPEQLRDIRMMKISHILLNNAGIQSVPKSAFSKGSNDNPFITSIDQIQLELSFWKEEKQNK